MIISELGREGIKVDPEDVAAEVTLVANTQVSYGGFTPYMMVYGFHPPEIVDDLEDGTVAQHAEAELPFYQHQKVRVATIQ
eukprot:2452158-Alexandrium_andersonii.AAC.1